MCGLDPSTFASETMVRWVIKSPESAALQRSPQRSKGPLWREGLPMRARFEALEVDPGVPIALRPSGDHIMLEASIRA